RFSPRYFAIELLTGLGFMGVFYCHAIRNVYDLDVLKPENLPFGQEQITLGFFPLPVWLLVGFHVLLFCLLVVASFIDIDHMAIPFVVTGTGTFLGLVAGALLWPQLPAAPPARDLKPVGQGPQMPAGRFSPFLGANPEPRPGIYPAPVWNKL